MYRLAEFRIRVQELSRRAAPYDGKKATAGDLAAAIGLSREELSRRLNGTGRTKLDNSNVRAIVRTLVEWGAITTRFEALELLRLVECPPFTASEWQAPPLSMLTDITQPDKHLHNLPAPMTSFVGRQEGIEIISDMLRQPDVRLVTLTGLGGSGKTRLSIQVAGSLASEYADGTYFVALATISDPCLVVSAIAQVLELKETPDKSPIVRLKGYLRDRQMLLVLDNFEQVIEAAPFLVELLAAAEHVKIIVTSRERLHIYGEHNFVVPPLAVPGADASMEEVAQNPAAQLFIQRAQAVLPGFRLTASNAPTVAEISSRLDGLPLAIELAASQIRLFSPEDILKHLSDRLGFLTDKVHGRSLRQHSLRDAIEWSYDLLAAPEQQLFRRLSVFVGGCTIDAAGAIVASEGIEVRDHLSSLVDKSLLQSIYTEEHEETRFVMLETIREYAQTKLLEYGETEQARKLHAEYYGQIIVQAEPELIGPQQVCLMRRLDREYDNIRAALRWADVSSPQLMAVIAANMGRYWKVRGFLNEGFYWLQKSAQKGSDLPKDTRLLTLRRLGQTAHHKGNYGLARECFSELLSLATEFGDDLYAAHALLNMATVISDADTSLELLAKAMPLYLAVGDKTGQADVYHVEGNIAKDRGNYDLARELYLRSLTLRRELGQQSFSAAELGSIATLHLETGDYEAALPHLMEALNYYQEAGLIIETILVQKNLGSTHFFLGNYTLAKRFFKESARTAYAAGSSFGLSAAFEGCAYLFAADGNYSSAAALLAAARRIDKTISDDLSVGEMAQYLVNSADAAGQKDEALIALNWVRSNYAGLSGEAVEAEASKWLTSWRIGETMSIEDALGYVEE